MVVHLCVVLVPLQVRHLYLLTILLTEVAKVSLNGREMDDLSGIFSTGSYIHPRMVEFYSFNVYYFIGTVTMASASLSVEKARYCQETLQVNEHD